MNLYITDDKKEMIKLGKMIAQDKQDIYTPELMNQIRARIHEDFPDLKEDLTDNLMYCSMLDIAD